MTGSVEDVTGQDDAGVGALQRTEPQRAHVHMHALACAHTQNQVDREGWVHEQWRPRGPRICHPQAGFPETRAVVQSKMHDLRTKSHEVRGQEQVRDSAPTEKALCPFFCLCQIASLLPPEQKTLQSILSQKFLGDQRPTGWSTEDVCVCSSTAYSAQWLSLVYIPTSSA